MHAAGARAWRTDPFGHGDFAILSSSRVLRGHVAPRGALVGRARACAVADGHGDGRVPQSEARSVVYPRNQWCQRCQYDTILVLQYQSFPSYYSIFDTPVL